MRIASAIAITISTLTTLAACSGDEVTVGKSGQALTTKADGSPTGDGATCSWSGTTAYDALPKRSSSSTTYRLGQDFAALDGCNTCSCTAKGIMCTVLVCTGGGTASGGGSGSGGGSSTPGSDPVACPDLAKQCPDGSYVGATGPDCLFECPSTPSSPVVCTDDAKLCPDGKTFVTRSGPSCAFAACP